jgi:hypothetical protein
LSPFRCIMGSATKRHGARWRIPLMSAALSSWKEIAAYLGKGVRTVQRWERQFGLPVRRPNAKSHVIFALPQELDAWVRRQQKNNHHPTDALQTTKKERQKQHELLSQLWSSYSRLDRNLSRLLEGFRANSVDSNPKQSSQSRAGSWQDAKFRKMPTKGAA